MFIVKHKNFFAFLSLLLVVLSFIGMFTWGINEGIDFKGGSIMEIAYPVGRRPEPEAVRQALKSISSTNFGEVAVQPAGDARMVLRMRDITESERMQLLSLLGSVAKTDTSTTTSAVLVEQKKFNSIGPVIGSELREKSWLAIVAVIILIVLFIAYAFRKVSAPVTSWKYGISAIIALVHDVIIPLGFLALMGHYYGMELDILFVTALLAILGFSVHDTIVVFDRVRENLKRHAGKTFEETVGISLSQTYGRSISTSLTVFIVLLTLYLVGGESTRNFALVLIVGIISGTYSSIFLASPLLVYIENWQKKPKK
ncbi:MAG: protein translocase subunit SecF [Candidatus Vogelbacteria bacterium]|nr:protein translocase subunit SecF [Candidatus Vogelbacteria bacterium]